MAKQLTFESDAREAVLRGVGKLAKAVVSTLGPRGRNAVLDKGWGGPTVTKDGVSVAEEIELSDSFENMGCKLVREAASKTSDIAGDGTTTVVTADRELAVVAENRVEVGEQTRVYGVAVVDHRILIRTGNELICIASEQE